MNNSPCYRPTKKDFKPKVKKDDFKKLFKLYEGFTKKELNEMQEEYCNRKMKQGMSKEMARVLSTYYMTETPDGKYTITNPEAYVRDNEASFIALKML